MIAMKKYRVLLITALLVLLPGVLSSQFAQNVPTSFGNADEPRKAAALGLIRTINTAEVVEATTYGSFAPWQTLLAHVGQDIKKCLQENGMQLGPAPEVLPGWRLRLNVSADGKAYDLMLEDVANRQAGYAAYSNETGVIWNAAPLQ
jgi:hypothetical protein